MCGIIGYAAPGTSFPSSSKDCSGSNTAATIRPASPSSTAKGRAPAGQGQDPRPGEEVRRHPLAGAYGIGHTRWATHGRPSEDNAHPHSDCSGTSSSSTTASSRTTSRSRSGSGRRPRLQDRDRHRGHRPPDREALPRAPWRRPCGRPVASSKARSPWPRSSATIRAGSWPPSTARRSSSGSGTARRSCPRTSTPSSPTPGGSSSWRTARWPSWSRRGALHRFRRGRPSRRRSRP